MGGKGLRDLAGMLYITYPGSSIKIGKLLDFLLSLFPLALENFSSPFPNWLNDVVMEHGCVLFLC